MSVAHIMSPGWLRDHYLIDIPTKSRGGRPYPDSVYATPIYSAIDAIEKATGLNLTGHKAAAHEERLDSLSWDGDIWSLKYLAQRPIAKINSIGIQYGNFPASTLPMSWFLLRDAKQGRFQVTLGPGAFQMPMMQTPLGYSIGLSTGRVVDPGRVRVSYTSGFVVPLPATATVTEGSNLVTLTALALGEGDIAKDVVSWLRPGHYIRVGTDPRVLPVHYVDATLLTLVEPAPFSATAPLYGYLYDPVILETVAMSAAIPILEMVGTFLLGHPAVSGKSLGMDALHQGKTYAVAPGKGPFAALQNTYRETVERNMASLLRTYERIEVFSF